MKTARDKKQTVITLQKVLKKIIMQKKNAIRVFILLMNMAFNYDGSAQNMMTKKIEALPRDLEMQLAMSALPPHLRDSASVYILNPDKGFELARKGTNGFHTFVARTGDDAMRGSWALTEYRDDILYPISFDETGSKSQMPVFFDIAEMQAKGMNPDEVKKLIKERYKNNYYNAPVKPGVSYMLSPILRTYTDPDKDAHVFTASVPHVMYYAPNVTNKEVGGSIPGSPYPHVILAGPHGYNIQVLGNTEKEAVVKGYSKMLDQLCAINKEWCLPVTNNIPKSAEHQHHKKSK